MEVTGPILHSLADEHVIGIDPRLKPDQPGVWRRRINAFTGRAVSDKALTAEQDMRSGLQRLHGMSMTAGIVDGLTVTTDRLSVGKAPGEAWLRLSPGLGLARTEAPTQDRAAYALFVLNQDFTTSAGVYKPDGTLVKTLFSARRLFAGTNVESNFLCSLGYGDGSVLFPRSPRFEFDEMARIL